MSRQVTFDYSKAGSFISEEEIGYMKKLTLDAKETLVSKTGAGNDFLGWIDLPVDYDKEEFARISEENPERFRRSVGYRYRWFLFGSQSGYRVLKPQLLQCAG